MGEAIHGRFSGVTFRCGVILYKFRASAQPEGKGTTDDTDEDGDDTDEEGDDTDEEGDDTDGEKSEHGEHGRRSISQ